MPRSRVVRSESAGPRAVRLARAGTALLVLSADLTGGPLELLRLDPDLRVAQRLALSDGSRASLVADERFIAVGAFEAGGYDVRLSDARTLLVVAARMLTGDVALSPWPVPARSDLQSVRRTRATSLQPWAPQEPESSGERAVARAHGHTVLTGVSAGSWVIAVSR